MTRYHLSPRYNQRAGSGQRDARASRRSITALIIALFLLSGTSAFAQGTPMPHPLIQWFTNAGAPANGYGLCVFRAGTSTLATTYTTAGLSVANANPILMNSAGRPTSGGVFLVPGESYKFVFKDATVTTCVPDTGVTVFTVDNVTAVPGSAAAVDVTATAGESISAGEAVYVSTGAGGLNAGQVYKTDADLAYKSTSAVMVGIAPNAIVSGASGTIRISGSVTVTGPLSTGSPYYAGTAAGAIVTTPPTNAIRIGIAQSATALIVGYPKAPISPIAAPCGRLTLTTSVPITRTDVTAATTVYYTPAGHCNTIDLYDGTAWETYAFAEVSIAVPATTNTAYDVYAYDNAGVVALELTAWTNLTTRATAIVLQNGVWVKTGALTRRLVGSFRTTGVSGQTEDSVTKRYVSNAYNTVPREFFKTDATATWNYTTATIRQANGAAANQVEVFISVIGQAVHVSLQAAGANSGGVSFAAGIGRDTTTTFTRAAHASGSFIMPLFTEINEEPVVGHHVYSWNEWSAASGTTAWYGTSGDSTPAGVTNGLAGWTEQ